MKELITPELWEECLTVFSGQNPKPKRSGT